MQPGAVLFGRCSVLGKSVIFGLLVQTSPLIFQIVTFSKSRRCEKSKSTQVSWGGCIILTWPMAKL